MKISDIQSLLAATYSDWSKYLANPRYVRKDHLITWDNYKSGSAFTPVSVAELVKLSDEGQYSFQIADGSLIQLYYEFGGKSQSLSKARLAFYKAPTFDQGATTEGDSLSWVRIDHSPLSATGILHSETHLHLSGFPEGRILVAGVPTPRQFVEFVMAVCYPRNYSEHRLHANGSVRDPGKFPGINSRCLRIRAAAQFQQMTHIRVPGAL